ncbi:hypothetical protein [Marinifilum caeruleilacunae]|uniref:Uncharacterized protein n=1 Tax=Marinifilum caeruleilacunae TaxID=2499076 RepID=A0ABX1X232_9BACT|nr:hypothetical protein [Marinifilum caeruleilacunae]NOU62379.1 hypothetical protein [Marinifilum caeruleilacunae]
MFGFKKNKNKRLTKKTCVTFLEILTNLLQILKKSNIHEQAKFIEVLIVLLNQRKDEQFIDLINSVNMWGGSGAVWEVHIEDSADNRSFEKEIVNLIDFMEKINILGPGVKPIRKLFKQNIKGKL